MEEICRIGIAKSPSISVMVLSGKHYAQQNNAENGAERTGLS
jgi:hypothetical protein